MTLILFATGTPVEEDLRLRYANDDLTCCLCHAASARSSSDSATDLYGFGRGTALQRRFHPES